MRVHFGVSSFFLVGKGIFVRNSRLFCFVHAVIEVEINGCLDMRFPVSGGSWNGKKDLWMIFACGDTRKGHVLRHAPLGSDI